MASALQVSFQDNFAVQIHNELICRFTEEVIGIVDVMLINGISLRNKDRQRITGSSSGTAGLLPLFQVPVSDKEFLVN
jgi:hypothetical protein